MSEATLPLFPEAPLFSEPGMPGAEEGALGRHGETEYRELPVGEILQPNRSARLPYRWTLNPYRGCELACSYCWARRSHGYLGLDARRGFESRIFVKRGARRALERRLKRASLAGESIALGTITDPYQPAERRFGVTRSLLEALRTAAGLDLTISTRSPLILRDLDLLAELDRRHTLTVNLTLITADPRLARRIEPDSPDPRARLRALQGLAAEGIAVRLCCAPVLPRIGDTARVVEPLVAAARAAGAFDVAGTPLSLPPAARLRFWPWLRAEFADLVPVYKRLYRRRAHLRRRDREAVLADLRRQRLRHGFPVDRPGRA